MSKEIKSTQDVIVGEVISDDEAQEKKQRIAKRELSKKNAGSYISKSNSLIQKTKYSLPRNEQKLLFMLMSKIDQKNDCDPQKYYTISFMEFATLTGVATRDTTYLKNLKETIESLEGRAFWIKKETGNVYKSMSWIQRGSEIDLDKKEVRLRFNPDIFPDITQLKSNYTSYNIEYLLTMKSTYSMRVYEIILSYDNGSRDYGYTNGLVFEPMTEQIYAKFPEKREALAGFKYKRFDMEEFKGLLSVPAKEEMDKKKAAKKDSEERAARYSREKPLSEKYKTFTSFEKNVLKSVKAEINQMTDLWFDYEPVRRKGVRKYEYLYIFIKYKTKEEMQEVRAYHNIHQSETEIPRKPKADSSKKTAAAVVILPLPDDILDMKYRKVAGEVKKRTNFSECEEKLSADEKNILADTYMYVAKILTNTNKRDQAEEALEALNRVIKDNGSLTAWAMGMCVKFQGILEKARAQGEKPKSAQYYRTVVFSDIVENSAETISAGNQRLSALKEDSAFKFDISVFDEI